MVFHQEKRCAEYFEAVHREKKVKCLLCNPHKEIVFQGGTTNLREHPTSQSYLSGVRQEIYIRKFT